MADKAPAPKDKLVLRIRREHGEFLRGLARAARTASEQAVVTDEAFKDDEEIEARNKRANNMKRLAEESIDRLSKALEGN